VPGLDITSRLAPGRQYIQGYGDGRFRVAGTVYEGSVIVLSESTQPWPVTEAGAVAADSLAPVIAEGRAVELLVVGCGKAFVPPPKGLREALREHGLALEWMDTGAACRTFDVLLTEGRAVAAALIAVE